MKYTFLTILFFSLSFIFSSCFNWGPRAFNNFPEETALDKTYHYDGKVIIIGAGASGLAAAKILERNNIDYKILEATNRYGGRLKKDTTLADFPIDIGAEWIHNMPAILNRLKRKKGNKVDEVLIPYHLENAANWDGKKLEEIDKQDLDDYYDFFPEQKFKQSTWYDFVNNNFAQEVKDNIVYNTPVTAINYGGEQVEVTTKGGETYTADKVLLTVSLGVLKSRAIAFVPDLSSKKKETIDAISFKPGFKLLMKFSEKFYPDVINMTETGGDVTYYDVAFKKEASSHILGALVLGDYAKGYYDLPVDDEIVSAILKELDVIFQGRASKFYTGNYVLENWGRHEYTLGTWVNAATDKNLNLKMLNQPLQNKVYFAGEVYDRHKQLGVPGALLSGYDGIDLLLTDED